MFLFCTYFVLLRHVCVSFLIFICVFQFNIYFIISPIIFIVLFLFRVLRSIFLECHIQKIFCAYRCKYLTKCVRIITFHRRIYFGFARSFYFVIVSFLLFFFFMCRCFFSPSFLIQFDDNFHVNVESVEEIECVQAREAQPEWVWQRRRKSMSHSLYCISSVYEIKKKKKKKQIRIWIVAIHLKVNILSLHRQSCIAYRLSSACLWMCICRVACILYIF